MKKHISISTRYDFSFLDTKNSDYKIALHMLNLVETKPSRRSSKSSKVHTLTVNTQQLEYLDQLITAIETTKQKTLQETDLRTIQKSANTLSTLNDLSNLIQALLYSKPDVPAVVRKSGSGLFSKNRTIRIYLNFDENPAQLMRLKEKIQAHLSKVTATRTDYYEEIQELNSKNPFDMGIDDNPDLEHPYEEIGPESDTGSTSSEEHPVSDELTSINEQLTNTGGLANLSTRIKKRRELRRQESLKRQFEVMKKITEDISSMHVKQKDIKELLKAAQFSHLQSIALMTYFEKIHLPGETFEQLLSQVKSLAKNDTAGLAVLKKEILISITKALIKQEREAEKNYDSDISHEELNSHLDSLERMLAFMFKIGKKITSTYKKFIKSLIEDGAEIVSTELKAKLCCKVAKRLTKPLIKLRISDLDLFNVHIEETNSKLVVHDNPYMNYTEVDYAFFQFFTVSLDEDAKLNQYCMYPTEVSSWDNSTLVSTLSTKKFIPELALMGHANGMCFGMGLEIVYTLTSLDTPTELTEQQVEDCFTRGVQRQSEYHTRYTADKGSRDNLFDSKLFKEMSKNEILVGEIPWPIRNKDKAIKFYNQKLLAHLKETTIVGLRVKNHIIFTQLLERNGKVYFCWVDPMNNDIHIIPTRAQEKSQFKFDQLLVSEPEYFMKALMKKSHLGDMPLLALITLTHTDAATEV